jgi:hypothetical protein
MHFTHTEKMIRVSGDWRWNSCYFEHAAHRAVEGAEHNDVYYYERKR